MKKNTKVSKITQNENNKCKKEMLSIVTKKNSRPTKWEKGGWYKLLWHERGNNNNLKEKNNNNVKEQILE